MKLEKKTRGKWSFGGKIPKKFDTHIKKSVPFYDEGHQIILGLSDYFLSKKSLCYDLGCSSASLLIKLSKFTNKENVKFKGLEINDDMYKFANKNLKISNVKNIKLFKKDISNYNLLKSNLIISYYTMQFIHPSLRQKIYDKIYKSLNWGGAFIIFEKIRGNDARFDNILNSLYWDFKEKNQFTSKEIIQKSQSLRGVLEPFSDKGNLGYLKRSGFSDIQTIFQYLCFKGYLCIK